MIIHLNGWPGVGKKTIGTILASRLGARFIDNHCLHDPALACAGFDDPARWPLYETVRDAAYAVLRDRPAGEIFVMTNALSTKSDRELQSWRLVAELAMARVVPLVPIILTAERDELLRRVASPDRNPRKLTDPATLSGYLEKLHIQHPLVPETLVLDVTDLDPGAAANAIQNHLKSVSSKLPIATIAHLALR